MNLLHMPLHGSTTCFHIETVVSTCNHQSPCCKSSLTVASTALLSYCQRTEVNCLASCPDVLTASLSFLDFEPEPWLTSIGEHKSNIDPELSLLHGWGLQRQCMTIPRSCRTLPASLFILPNTRFFVYRLSFGRWAVT